MLYKVLNFPDAAKIIFKLLSIKDHTNLAEVMLDDYMYYLLTTLNEEERKPILMENFDRIPLDKFKNQTLDCLCKRYWRYISRFAKMKENFIIKWSHKIHFMLLKQNASKSRYNNDISILRPFSRKFHKLFPGFKDYRPCCICWVDTQWFQDIDVSSPEDKCTHNWFKYWEGKEVVGVVLSRRRRRVSFR